MRMNLFTGKVRRLCGQSAMEFLLTYGWAVLIMLIILAVLFYLGVFSPQNAAPNFCILPSGFSCNNYAIGDGGTLLLDIGQATGKNIRISRVACDASDTPSHWVTIDARIKTGRHYNFSGVTCYNADNSTPEAGEYYRGTIFIEYTEEETGIAHKIRGEIAYRIEQTTGGGAPTPTPSPITGCGTISSPGYYVLQNNLNSSGTCITITSGGSNSTLDCQGRTINGSNSSNSIGVYLSSATGVTVKNCVITNFVEGIRLDYSNNNTFTGNTVRSDHFGMYFYSSSNNTLTSNTANSNDYGIILDASSNNNTLTSNTANSNGYGGIILEGNSNNNTLAGNNASLNDYGISVYSSNNIVFSGNTACNNADYDFYCSSSSTSGNSTYGTNYDCTVNKIGSCS